MSYAFYKWLHLTGIFLTLMPLGGMLLHMMNGGTRDFARRKVLGALHGLGTLLALVGGFGLLARQFKAAMHIGDIVAFEGIQGAAYVSNVRQSTARFGLIDRAQYLEFRVFPA